MNNETHVFIKPCGCLSSAMLNTPHNYSELAKAFRYAERHEETYKLMDTQAVREMEWTCAERKKAKAEVTNCQVAKAKTKPELL